MDLVQQYGEHFRATATWFLSFVMQSWSKCGKSTLIWPLGPLGPWKHCFFSCSKYCNGQFASSLICTASWPFILLFSWIYFQQVCVLTVFWFVSCVSITVHSLGPLGAKNPGHSNVLKFYQIIGHLDMLNLLGRRPKHAWCKKWFIKKSNFSCTRGITQVTSINITKPKFMPEMGVLPCWLASLCFSLSSAARDDVHVYVMWIRAQWGGLA